MIVRNKKAIEREKKLLNDLLVKTGYTKPKTKFRYEFPDLSVRKTVATTNKVGNGLAKIYGTYTGTELLGIGTLHKSNAVPIRKDSNDAKDQANMRR
tara:strand:+ start:331 stop:621 length:291 start_codon:yes stop_codon:yes gene_type:complete